MTEDQELEQFFKDLQMKNDLDNFIKHNEYPSYLKRTTQYNKVMDFKQKYPVIDENVENSFPYKVNYSAVANDLNRSILKCNETIKVMIENEPEREDSCPVCLSVFEETNYVIPRCGHKVCAVCFTNNIKHNKHTGDCCVICRQRIC